MAYINQDMKKQIVADLKKVMPKGWKWTVSIRDHSTFNLNVSVITKEFKLSDDMLEAINKYGYAMIGYNSRKTFDSDEHEKLLSKIWSTINKNNYDNSDSQSDYFDVGFYAYINFGRWNRPLDIH